MVAVGWCEAVWGSWGEADGFFWPNLVSLQGRLGLSPPLPKGLSEDMGVICPYQGTCLMPVQ